jgi:putative transcriptional regulator
VIIKHHPSHDLLLAYAAGDIGETWSLVIATHMALCPDCRHVVRDAEAIGGALIDEIAPERLARDALVKTLAYAATVEANSAAVPKRPRVDGARPILPQPLRDYAGGDVDALRWRRLGRGPFHIPLIKSQSGEVARLLKIPAGQSVPEHGHNGIELTLVLSGSFADKTSRFGRGDLETADPELVHQPIVEASEDCICLAVTDAPLRFRSPLARLVQPFIGI